MGNTMDSSPAWKLHACMQLCSRMIDEKPACLRARQRRSLRGETNGQCQSDKMPTSEPLRDYAIPTANG